MRAGSEERAVEMEVQGVKAGRRRTGKKKGQGKRTGKD